MKPEDFQKQFEDLFRRISDMDRPAGAVQKDETGEPPEPPAEEPPAFAFDYRPKQVKQYLDRYVIRQEEAKKVLSVALCDHYHHVRLSLEGNSPTDYAKQNILLLGPTGIGKTYLIRSLAKLIGVPFVKGDATKFSDTGYVGGDVEDLVRELYRRADGDVRKAQFGIIYIDEIDKIARTDKANRMDVGGLGVQTNLLKLMEDTEVPVRSQQDVAGQFQAIMEMQSGRKTENRINTGHILFIVSGVFDGLDKIIEKRLQDSSVGFAAASRLEAVVSPNLLDEVTTRDLIKYGFEPEFMGRLPVRVVCQPLGEDDLYEILKKSEGSIVRQYEADFSAYGIEAKFSDEALRRIAAQAAQEKTGARGLMTVCERIFRNFKYELSDSTIRCFAVTPEVIDDSERQLAAMLRTSDNPDLRDVRQALEEFVRQFQESHQLTLRFTESGVRRLLTRSVAEKTPVEEICRTQFRDYQFGLKLIFRNTGRQEFELDQEAVDDPERVLSEWVVASYRAGEISGTEPNEGNPVPEKP